MSKGHTVLWVYSLIKIVSQAVSCLRFLTDGMRWSILNIFFN